VVLADSNVLLDVIQDDPQWADWSATQIERLADAGELAINPIVFAEVSVAYAHAWEVDQMLDRLALKRLDLPWEAAFLAGKAFMAYRQRGGARRSPLPDFYIGAHAAVAGCKLLTRDEQRYRTYFPGVKLIAPDQSTGRKD
jgi:predicted nucleic acid-binding protein